MAWLLLAAVLGVLGTLAIYAAVAAAMQWLRGDRYIPSRDTRNGLPHLARFGLSNERLEASSPSGHRRLVSRSPRRDQLAAGSLWMDPVPEVSLQSSRVTPTDIAKLRELRRRYIEAAQLCERCAEIMEEHATKGTTPSEEDVHTQSDARHELVSARRAFLEGLTLYKLRL